MANESVNESTGAQGGGQAEIVWGVYSDTDNYAGRTVSQVREDLGGVWNIPNDATVFVDNKAVGDDYVIKDGDQVEFSRRTGEKG